MTGESCSLSRVLAALVPTSWQRTGGGARRWLIPRRELEVCQAFLAVQRTVARSG